MNSRYGLRPYGQGHSHRHLNRRGDHRPTILEQGFNSMIDKVVSHRDSLLANLSHLLPDLKTLYTDIHSHPELSMQETRTAGIATERLRAAGYEVSTG